jgi:S-adenosyl methyltransferase
VHARALLRSGGTAVVEADLRDSAALLDRRAVGRVLDLDRPVGVLLLGVLQHVPDADDPWSAVRHIVGALPAGSYVAVAALASDLDVELVEDVVGAAARFGIQISPRPRDAVAAFLQGLDLVGPGVVPLLDWRLSPADDALDWLLDRLGVLDVPVWAGVGRTR